MSIPDKTAAEPLARSFIDAFLAGDFETLRGAGDAAFAAALKPEILAAVRAQLGAVRARRALKLEPRDGLVLVEAGAEFEGGAVAFRIALREGALVGFFVVPLQPPAPEWRTPDYVDDARFVEEAASVGPLPGAFTRPKGVRRPPVCLLVHGSGPADRDETVGRNKPFRDLAQGLATRGVASLRYDKRTFALPAAFAALASPTVKEEVLDDVATALQTLALRDDVGPLVVVGHSLGALLAPRIVEENRQAAAAVMIAAPARPLVDVTLAQLEYLNRLKPSGQLDDVRAQAARVRAAQPGDTGEPFLGAPLSWWANLNRYDPVAAARRIETPLLILHGGRDYQVTDADYEGWRAGLEDRANVRLRRFPQLNHLMIAGQGQSEPAEYQLAGHVDVAVIESVAEFALGL